MPKPAVEIIGAEPSPLEPEQAKQPVLFVSIGLKAFL
jgi:hypothetical protein